MELFALLYIGAQYFFVFVLPIVIVLGLLIIAVKVISALFKLSALAAFGILILLVFVVVPLCLGVTYQSLGAGFHGGHYFFPFGNPDFHQNWVVSPLVSGGLIILLSRIGAILCGVYLGIELYRKWTENNLKPDERKPGLEGFKAWLTPRHIGLCIGLAACAWIGFGASFLEYLVLSLLVVCAYPVITLLSHPRPAITPAQDLSQARNKILDMLAEKKITLEESKELLEALGEKKNPGEPDTQPASNM